MLRLLKRRKVRSDSPKHGGFYLKHGGETGAQATEWPFAQGSSSKLLSFHCLIPFLWLLFAVSSLQVLLWAERCAQRASKTHTPEQSACAAFRWPL